MNLFRKPIIAIGLIFFGLSTFTYAQSNFLITPDSVGKLKIGMKVSDARKVLPRHSFTRTSDGEGIALIEVKRRGRTHFYLYADEFDPDQPVNNNAQISFIEVVNSAYRTANGVYPNMRLRDVERKYGKLQEIVTSEIESREYARFANQPAGIDLKVNGINGQAGVYANGEMRTSRYSRSAKIGSIILLGRSTVGDTNGTGDGTGTTVELGFTSKYTDLKTQCRTPRNQGDNGGHISTYCTGYGGYRLHIFDSANAMHINVQSNDQSVSVPVANQDLGFDMNTKKVEWRFKDGKPFAVIMRIKQYQMEEDLIRYPVRVLFESLRVVGLPGYEQIDYRVSVKKAPKPNEEARRWADRGYSQPNNTGKKFESVDIAPYNRTIANAARRNRAWVKSSMQVAVRLAGEISEIKTRTMEFNHSSAEDNTVMTLIITNDGLMDDSVEAERFVFDLKKDSHGVWRVNSGQKSWKCWQGRGHTDFSAVPCR